MSSQHQHSHQQQQHVINMTGLDSGPVTTTGLGGGVAAASGSGRLGTPGMASGSSTTNSASSSTTTHIPPGAYRSTSSQRSPHLHQSAYAPLSPTHNSSYMSPSLTSLSPISATSASTSQLGRSQSLGHAAYQQMQTASYNHSPSSSTAATLYPQQPLEAAPYRSRQPSSSEGGGALLPTINSHINRNPQPPTMQQQQQQMYSPGMRHSMVIDSHGYNAATGPPKSPLHRTQGGSSPYANSRPVSMYDMSYGLQPTSSPHHTMSPHHQTLSPRSSQQAQLHTDRSGGMLPTHVGPSGSGGDSLPMYSNNATGLLPTNSPYSSSSVQYTGAPPRTAAGAYEPSQMMEAGPSNHRERRGTLTSADVGMGDYAAWERQKQMGSSAAEMRAPAHPPPRLQEGFRRVRDLSDLKAVNEPAQAGIGRRADPSGGYVSPLKAMTSYLHHTYHLVNPAFFYELSFNPRRVLTKPSRPVHNDGHDNEDSDYILYVNDWLGAEEGNRYLILDVLGQGTFGQVVKCQNMKTREIVAVKVIKNKPAYFNQSMMEVTILEMLNNNWDPDDQHHILRLRDTFIHAKHLCLVFELLSSNLYELIKQNSFKGLSTSLVRVFTTQLLDALTVLHEARLIHCDLKPENILLKTLQTPSIKLVDFGSACHERQTVYTYIQSRFYRSPEVLLGLPYNASIDMWSLGCIAVELFLGLPLFPGTSEYNQVCRIVEMLGLPPAFMLEGGKQTGEFFNVYTDDYNRRSYKLKSLEQYSQEHNVDEQPSKRYFQATTLPDIIKTYPLARKSGKPADVQKEMANRNSFIDFVSGLLNMDPAKRWTPQQAKLHPFITGEKLAAPFKPPASPVTTLTRSKSTSAALNSTADSSRHPYGGLPQTPSRSSGRAYHDAAAYNQHLAQQQAYNSAHQARQNQPPMINNPYAQDEIRNQAAEASAAKAAAAAKTQAQVQVAQAQAQAHAHAQAQAQAHAQAQTHAAQMQAARSSPYGQPGNVSTAAAAASTYAAQQQQNSRSRSNTITRMDLVPGQLAKMGIDSGHSMTPVMSREESMREWERRQRNGRNDYQHLDSLQQQADLSQSAFSSPTGQQQQQSWSQLPGSSGQPYRMGTSTTSPSNSMMQPAQSFSVIVDAHQQQNRHASPSMQQQHHQSMTSPSRIPAGSAVPPSAGAYTNNASNARYQPMMGGQGSSNNASIAAFDPYNSDIAQLMPALQPTQYQGGAASHRNSMAGGSGQPQQHPAMTASASLSTSIYGSPVGGPISPTSPNHRSLEEGFVSPQQRQTQSPAHYQLPTASQGGRMRYG